MFYQRQVIRVSDSIELYLIIDKFLRIGKKRWEDSLRNLKCSFVKGEVDKNVLNNPYVVKDWFFSLGVWWCAI